MTIEEMKARHAALMEAVIEFNHGIWIDPRAGALIEHWVRREAARYENQIARQTAVINQMPKCANCGEPAVIRVGKIEDNEMICTKCGDILMTPFRSQR